MKRRWKLVLRTIWQGLKRRSNATRPLKPMLRRKLASKKLFIVLIVPIERHAASVWHLLLILVQMKKLLRCGPRTRLRYLHFKHSCAGSSWRCSRWRRALTRRWVKMFRYVFPEVLNITCHLHGFLISLFYRKRRLKSSPNFVMNLSPKSRRAELLCIYCIF